MKRYNKNAILLDEDTINGYNNEDLKAEKKYEAFEKYIDDIDYEMKNKREDNFICYARKNQSLTKHLSVYYTTELEELVGLYYSDVSDVFYEDGDLKTQFELNIIRPIYEKDLREILYNNKSFELLVLDVYDDHLVSGWVSYFDLKAEDSLRDEWQNLTDNEAWEKLLEEAIEEHIEYEIRSLKKTLGFQTIDNELQFEIFDKLPKIWNIVYGSNNKLEESKLRPLPKPELKVSKSVEDYAEDVCAMNEVLTYMNNEEAYYGTGWLYLYADGCSYDELKDYLSGEYGEPDELYQEYVDEFEHIYNYYHEDGLYDAPRKVEEYANAWDKKLGLEPIENIKRIKLNR